MEHLSQEIIEKFVRGDYPYLRLLEISAHLFTCKKDCKDTLNEIDPSFLVEAQRLEDARKRALANEKHFPEAEIENYVLKKFDINIRLGMNKHFTKCRQCTQQLKAKDPDYLSSFIKDNLNRNKESEITVKEEESGLFFRFLIPAAAFSLLIIISLVILFMIPNDKSNEQAKLEEISDHSLAANINENKPTSHNDNKEGTAPPNSANKPNETNAGSQPKPTTKPGGFSPTRKQPDQNKANKSHDIIVNNRSLNKNCESNPILAISPKDEVITDIQPNLSWKSYPNAVSYKVYLSDSANNLIEEADVTDNEKTSYKITKKLELYKKYEWKVVTSLKEGKEIYSEAARFSVGEKAKKLSPTKEKSKNNEVRCLKSGNKIQ